MSLVVEFLLPADSVGLDHTLSGLSDVSVKVEQNVWDAAADLKPYVWVTGESAGRFESVATEDESVVDLTHIASFEDAALFRLGLEHPETGFIGAVGAVDAVLQSASATGAYWTFTVRFDDREALSQFQAHCREEETSYEVTRMSQLSEPSHDGDQHGLTPKQHEALSIAHRMGYFRQPREATLEEIADCLDISRQALSRRLRRGQQQFFSGVFAADASDPLES